jgi:hypothetical protein
MALFRLWRTPTTSCRSRSSSLLKRRVLSRLTCLLCHCEYTRSGSVVREVPILTKGREGSWWETPAGIYKIESKESNHFSSFGKVYQPWSMAFQGNFFIHGWPYHPDGTAVSSTYSGGCIRLSTENAKEVYDLVTTGMPVLVYEKDFFQDGFRYSIEPPDVSAEHYLVADLGSDSVLFEKDSRATSSIASITKLITSLVAAEYINLDNTITISSNMLASTSKPRLKAGQEVSVYDLMFPLLMESSNEAATAISRQTGPSRFITLMNNKASSLGMKASHFSDPAGSNADNLSNAQDLFALAKYIYNNRSFVFKISSGNLTTSAYGDPSFKNLENFNIPPGTESEFVGGKIGKSTAAKETYLGVFTVSIHGTKRPIAIILLVLMMSIRTQLLSSIK